jgi:hypothetical protein
MRRASAVGNRVWWVDPGNFLIFVTLPVFVVGTTLGGPLMTDQFEAFNFLTRPMIWLGVASICLLAVGAKAGSAAAARTTDRGTCFDPHRFDQFLVLVLAVSLAAYLLMLGALLLEPSLVLSMLRGEGGMFQARSTLGRVVGITSLTNVAPVFWCMCSIRYVTRGAFFPSRQIAWIALLLPPLIFIQAFVGSQRLVLIESGLAFLLPLFSFAPRFRRLSIVAPFAGLGAVVIIFVVGEYMRTWVFYQATNEYDSFAQFVSLRLLAYLALAANSGAGMILTMPPVGYPLVTGQWLAKMPIVGLGPAGYQQRFLENFGNAEFNNTSGIYAPIIDFGQTIGILYLFVWGVVLGTLYGFYRRGHPVGLIAFPIFYIGLADLTQIWYWGQPPFVPQIIFIIAAIALTVRRPVLTSARSHS